MPEVSQRSSTSAGTVRRTARASIRTLSPSDAARVACSAALAALTAVTALMVSGCTHWVDVRGLAVLTALNDLAGSHRVARVVVAGGQLWLAGAVLVAAAARASVCSRSWRPVLVVGAALSVSSIATWGFKLGIDQPAPRAGAAGMVAGGMSYPSGHTVVATLTLPLLVALHRYTTHRSARPTPRTAAASLLTATGLTVIVAGVGLATVALGYHWPSDVVAGWLLGVAVTIPAAHALHRPGAATGPAP